MLLWRYGVPGSLKQNLTSLFVRVSHHDNSAPLTLFLLPPTQKLKSPSPTWNGVLPSSCLSIIKAVSVLTWTAASLKYQHHGRDWARGYWIGYRRHSAFLQRRRRRLPSPRQHLCFRQWTSFCLFNPLHWERCSSEKDLSSIVVNIPLLTLLKPILLEFNTFYLLEYIMILVFWFIILLRVQLIMKGRVGCSWTENCWDVSYAYTA